MKRLALVALIIVGCTTARVSERPLFEFHDNFWLNLHHYVRAVGRGMPAPGELTPEERAAWDGAVAFYRAHYVNRDLAFDQGMVDIKTVLRAYDGKSNLDGAAIDPELRSTLERIAPIYRKYWWPAHRDANEAWIAAALPLVRAHGRALSEKVSAAYGVQWPKEPVPVDLSVTAGANGAYTTSPPTHTTIASTDPSYSGLSALEMLFHEASHAWGLRLQTAIVASAAAHQKKVPPQLWHAVLFYNAGELTRRELAGHGVDGYVERAVKNDVYRNLCGEGCRDRVAAAWNRRLAGEVSVEQALDALVASWPS